MDRRRGARARWTKTDRDAFFDTLAASGSIGAAARRIGIDPAIARRWLLADDALAERWRAAMEASYRMIEQRLIGGALGGDGADDGFDPDAALKLLTWRQRHAPRRPEGEAMVAVASEAETDAAILAKLAVLDRRRQRTGEAAA